IDRSRNVYLVESQSCDTRDDEERPFAGQAPAATWWNWSSPQRWHGYSAWTDYDRGGITIGGVAGAAAARARTRRRRRGDGRSAARSLDVDLQLFVGQRAILVDVGCVEILEQGVHFLLQGQPAVMLDVGGLEGRSTRFWQLISGQVALVLLVAKVESLDDRLT